MQNYTQNLQVRGVTETCKKEKVELDWTYVEEKPTRNSEIGARMEP